VSGRLRIVVCDDHPIVRSGLVALLALQPDMEVVGEAEDGHAAVDLCRRLQPRLVLMDLSMPLLNGVDATAHIRQACPDTRVLVLSMHDDGYSARRARDAGASGYLVKGVGLAPLLDALRRVAAGGEAFGPALPAGAVPAAPLSPRERSVLQLIAEGYTNREIGLMLEISPKTVEKHRASLMEKLDAHETAGLTRWALRLGLVQLPPDGGAGEGGGAAG